MTYEHTQIGTVMLVAAALSAALAVPFALAGPELRMGIFVLAGVVVLLLLFSTLTTRVASGELVCRFGPGLIQKRLPLSAIRSVSVVRNPWYSGWGIRMGPRGMLWNVSGFDAVELELTSGKVFRIGTDEPRELARAIEQGIGAGRVG